MKKIYTVRNIAEQQAHMWDSVKIEDELAVCGTRKAHDYFFKYLPKGEVILEAGCGPGTWVIYLKGKGFDVSGIEHDKALISRIKGYAPDLPVHGGDVCSLPYADNSVGGYISLGVIEHFEDGCERPLKEALRVMKPGAVAIFTVPYNNLFRRFFLHPLRAVYLLVKKLRGLEEIHFAEHRYSVNEILVILRKAGLEVVEVGTDDYTSKSNSMVIWSELPFLRKGTHGLNIVGRTIAFVLNSISNKLIDAGILIVARKPCGN